MLLVADCYETRDKLRPDGPLGSTQTLPFMYFLDKVVEKFSLPRATHVDLAAMISEYSILS